MFYSEVPYADLIFQDATQKIITLKGSKYSWYVRNGLTDFLVMIRELLRFLNSTKMLHQVLSRQDNSNIPKLMTQNCTL